MAEIHVREGESLENALKRFRREVKKSNIFSDSSASGPRRSERAQQSQASHRSRSGMKTAAKSRRGAGRRPP